MDTFKDLFQEIKDLRNPFFSSFAIACLFFNWPITIALLFYDSEILKRSGYATYNDLIDARQDNWKILLYPFLSECLYVFACPYLRDFIIQFFANRKMENENKILEGSKKFSAELERYIDLPKELKSQQNRVGQIYSEQKKEFERMASLQSDFSKEQIANSELKMRLNEANIAFQSFRNNITLPNVLNGKWDISYKNDETIKSERWIISGDDIYLPEDKEFKIQQFMYNPAIEQIHLTLVD
ncbi:hypothetical protein [Pedobacter agri]|uniref:hypothetical protein n=1 Tax=Pedobacter agri TaxID=454586 RepID=UPI002785E540|nr:hypothetical protein [Pedobacter agri]MDQ1140101.1 hypothetical protein [Pedobacter agri]